MAESVLDFERQVVDLENKIKEIKSLSATEEVDNAVKKMKQAGITDIVSLGVGEPCFDTPENIKNAACNALMAGDTKYEAREVLTR